MSMAQKISTLPNTLYLPCKVPSANLQLVPQAWLQQIHRTISNRMIKIKYLKR